MDGHLLLLVSGSPLSLLRRCQFPTGNGHLQGLGHTRDRGHVEVRHLASKARTDYTANLKQLFDVVMIGSNSHRFYASFQTCSRYHRHLHTLHGQPVQGHFSGSFQFQIRNPCPTNMLHRSTLSSTRLVPWPATSSGAAALLEY